MCVAVPNHRMLLDPLPPLADALASKYGPPPAPDDRGSEDESDGVLHTHSNVCRTESVQVTVCTKDRMPRGRTATTSRRAVRRDACTQRTHETSSDLPSTRCRRPSGVLATRLCWWSVESVAWSVERTRCVRAAVTCSPTYETKRRPWSWREWRPWTSASTRRSSVDASRRWLRIQLRAPSGSRTWERRASHVRVSRRGTRTDLRPRLRPPLRPHWRSLRRLARSSSSVPWRGPFRPHRVS